MKQALFLGLSLLLTCGAQANITAQKAAITAQEKYDARDFTAAVQSYQQVLDDGLYSPEIFFNLGNAYFKSSDLPRALLNYRRAWYFTPGDPDLKANMKLASDMSGVVLPEYNLSGRIAYSLSQDRWVKCAQIAYLLTSVFIITAIAVSRGRTLLLKCAALPLSVALLACFGIWKWHNLYTADEQSILTPTTAKYGPTPTSTDHFKIPAGSIVSTHKIQTKGWNEINLNKNSGWVRKESSVPVVIWKH